MNRAMKTAVILSGTAVLGTANTFKGQFRAVRAAGPTFGSPLLFVPLHVTNKRVLRAVRKAVVVTSPLRDGVHAERRRLPGDEPGGGLDVVVHEPAGRTHPSAAVLWLHGGGLISGAAAGANAMASGLAADLGALVVAPDYRLAPEHPYPAAIDDSFAALKWLVDNATELGIDAGRIVVGGESAGAGLAAALAQRAHDAGIPLRLQVLLSPMLDDRTVVRAESAGIQAVVWSPKSNRFGWTCYLGHAPGGPEARRYAVPARREDLTGVAPAWIGIGTADLFYNESVEYARRLERAGVGCELVVLPGGHHGAELLKPNHPLIVDFAARRLEALRRATIP